MNLNRRIEITLVLVCIAASLLVLNNPPYFDGLFLVDDLEVWNAHNEGRFASSFLESIRNTQIDKWRPINTVLMIPLLQVFKDSYRNFYYFSTSLLALTLCALWMTARIIRRRNSAVSTSAALLGVLAVGSSPFTFMARSGVFGLLEIAPVILCLCSFSFYQSGKLNSSRRLVIYSSLFALAAGLIHERFFMFSVALAAIIAWRARTIIRWRGFWLIPIANLLFYVYSAALVLNANVLKGGGETRLNESAGLWIVRRLLLAALHLIGGASGETIFFDPANPNDFLPEMEFGDNYSLRFPLIILISILFIAWMFIRALNDNNSLKFPLIILISILLIAWMFIRALNDNNSLKFPLIILISILLIAWIFIRRRTNNFPSDDEFRFSMSCFAESLFIASALLLPGATVSGRIESRWLFASFVFLVLAIMILPSAMYFPSRVGQFVVLVLFIVCNYSGQNSYSEYNFFRIRANNVIEAVTINSERLTGTWNLAVVWPNLDGVYNGMNWALGGGTAFRELENKPNQIFLGTKDRIKECPSPCLIVEVSDIGNLKNNPSKFEFQIIKTSFIDSESEL